ncbi:Decaprenyl-diphosphate synthase subunit 1 [Plecturocebus cupreus]
MSELCNAWYPLCLSFLNLVSVLGCPDPVVHEIAYQYGKNVGIAFQLIDDVLDFTSCSDQMGKPTSADLKLGLATGPVLFACQQFPEMNAMIMRRFSMPGDVDRARQYVLQAKVGGSRGQDIETILAKWRLRQENRFNPGGGWSGPRSSHCTPAWATRVKLHLKNKKELSPSSALKYVQRTKREGASVRNTYYFFKTKAQNKEKSKDKNQVTLSPKSKTEKKKTVAWKAAKVQWLKPVIPALWEAEAGRSPEVRSWRPPWPRWRNPFSTKNTKISQACWHAPVIPATQEVGTGESLEPRRWRVQ